MTFRSKVKGKNSTGREFQSLGAPGKKLRNGILGMVTEK